MGHVAARSAELKNWLGSRTVVSPGSNVASKGLPFQSWRPFKEAFDPEVVHRAISETSGEVSRLLDPFGGSGTSALTAQFSGVLPTTIEVNPYLADLIEAKLTVYDTGELTRDFAKVLGAADSKSVSPVQHFRKLPPTFVEPGKNNKFIFYMKTIKEIAQVFSAIECECGSERTKTLFRILLSTIALEVSNVVISGKGRRYRKNWQTRQVSQLSIAELFRAKVIGAIADISRHGYRPETRYTLLRGDSRVLMSDVGKQDICVFSPPYPNSFDYTDVYNVELWLLGYLKNFEENRVLREQTLRSHVQVKRGYETDCMGSALLERTYEKLAASRSALWSADIPEMSVAYFSDMVEVLKNVANSLRSGGRAYCIVGDSKYANVPLPVAKILIELSTNCGLSFVYSERFRSMRASPQQGGKIELPETLLVFEKP